ncbi:MAG: serine hydrolase domain-containing protein [Candidatus Binataceae bacterium]
MGTHTLHRIIHVWIDSAGKLQVSIDEIEEHIERVRGDKAEFKDARFSYEVPYAGTFRGTLSDWNIIDGKWEQGGTTTPSILTRYTGGPLPTMVPTPTPAPAMPPVALDNLKPALDRELAPVLEHGLLSPQSGGGLVIGVLDHGQRKILAYGAARPDSIFEIGSVTKPFTGLLLAQMVVQKTVTLDEPVRLLLPADWVAKPEGPEITLLDLATHCAGLPNEAYEYVKSNPPDYFHDFGVPQLRDFLAHRGLAKPSGTGCAYSDLGFELLGYALSLRAGVPYSRLVAIEIIDPLGMKDTEVTLSPEQRTRLIQGYNGEFHPVDWWDWDSDVLDGSGLLKSTAADLLIFLDANLHPEKYAVGAAPNSPAATLPDAFTIAHQLRIQAQGEGEAMDWGVDRSGNYRHAGASTGHNSYAAFNPTEDQAIVVLYNRMDWNSSDPITFPWRIAENVRELMSGRPSIPLDVLSSDERASLNRPTRSH